jgi:NodT family efflux transporter outer membrane factor (OMF) lipoprotein
MKFVHTHFVKILFALALSSLAALFAGCSLAPHYQRPAVETPVTFKESPGTNDLDTNIWQVAQPSDAVIRSNWWQAFNDTNLDALEDQVAISNQNVVVAFEQYRVAHEMVREAQAEYFPTLTATPSVTRQRTYTGGGLTLRNPNVTVYDLPLDGSWQPDLWGKVRNTVRSSAAQAQASAADLENTRLTAQTELASDYFQLRGQDALIQLYSDTVGAYSNSLSLTKVLFKTGIDSDEDVAQAETQLETTEANATNLGILRTQLEHAIAVLMGRAPEDFSIPAIPATVSPPPIPSGVPSQLLQRRPDIASAERTVASANAEIGVARAAFFPNVTLSASGGFESPLPNTLLQWGSRVWAIGASASQPVFNAALPAAVIQYRAAYDSSVAQYRQTVLTAFQQVEDNLSALRILRKQIQQQNVAVKSSQTYLNLATYRYKLGIDSYLNVITAQTTYLDNRQTLVNLYTQQMEDALTLIEDLGGGWKASELPKN